MKAHFFYSPANQKMITIIANDVRRATELLKEALVARACIVNDYIYDGAIVLTEGSLAITHIGAYDAAYYEENTSDDIPNTNCGVDGM